MDDAEEVKALAEKLMTHPHPEGPTSIELLLRRLPAEWAVIPTPPGAQLLGTALYSRRGRPRQVDALYNADRARQAVVSSYAAALQWGGRAVFSSYGGSE